MTRRHDINELLPPGRAVRSRTLRSELSHRQILAALEAKEITRLKPGWYRQGPPFSGHVQQPAWSKWHTGPSEQQKLQFLHERALAEAYGATLSGLSAANAWHWMLPQSPVTTTLTVAPNRRISGDHPNSTTFHWRRLDSRDRAEGITSPLTTALHCGSTLPFPQAVAVLDSALRSRSVTRSQLLEAADTYRGRGTRSLREAARAADERAANPFESMVRAAAMEVQGVRLVPQVGVVAGGMRHYVDLCDRDLQIIVECDSYEFHMADKALWERDLLRYNLLTAEGWTVIRANWGMAFHHPHELRLLLADAVESRRRPRTK